MSDVESVSLGDANTELAALRDERLKCAGAEHLRLLKSHAKAEQMVTREYAGRAIIELIQNARDAARTAGLDPSDCEVLVWVEPSGEGTVALSVANRGVAITVPVVRASLSQIGESTKTAEIEAGAIGHKGVGFRSVLELGDVVEVCSGQNGSSAWTLNARFDRRVARDLCRELSSEHWEALRGMGEHEARVVAEMEGDEPVFACLYAPLPLADPSVGPARLTALDGRLFDTVVHLPSANATKVREQVAALRPEMLLLLGQVRRVRYCGPAAETDRTLEVTPYEHLELDGGLHVQDFSVSDGDELWRMFAIDEMAGIDGDLRIGVPLHAQADAQPLHLYFPTRIASGTPLLLHGPFRVDASRKHFSDGFAEDNERAVEALATFWRKQVLPQLFKPDGPADNLAPRDLLLAFSTAPPSEGGLATELRDEIQQALLACHCIPTTLGDHAPASELIVSAPQHFDDAIDAELLREFGLARPADLPADMLGWLEPHAWALEPELMTQLLARGARRAEESGDVSWFSRMLRLLDAWRSWGPGLPALLEALGDTPVLPARVAGTDRDLDLIPLGAEPPVYYRASAEDLAVPRCLGFRLLHPDVLAVGARPGDLDSGLKAVAEGHLGLRPLETGPVVEDIASQNVGVEYAPEVLRFVADLLAQARGALQLDDIPPTAVGTSHAGLRWQRDEGSRKTHADERRRRRNLSSIRLPCRDGYWHAASDVLVGAEWGTRAGVLLERVYEETSVAWLASPDVLVKLAPALDSTDDLLRLVLRLGAWTTPPVNSLVEYRRDREASLEDRHAGWVRHLVANGHLKFDGYTVPASRVTVRVDHDLRHPAVLETPDADALVELLELQWQSFFAQLRSATLACWRPVERTRKRAVERSDVPSTLMWRLGHTPWFPTQWDGHGAQSKVRPNRIWVDTHVSRTGQPPANSRYQFVAIAARGHEGALLHGIGGIRAAEPEAEAARSELLRVRRLVCDEDGLVQSSTEASITIRRNSPRERALGTLCGMLLEGAAGEHASVTGLPVLAKQDGRLRFVDPLEDDVFYTGDASQRDQQAFKYLLQAVLPRDRKGLASRLGLKNFSVVWEPQFEGGRRDDTERVRALVQDRMAHIVALRLYWQPSGVPPFEPDGEEQQKRLDRLIGLQYFAVDDLEILARIDGTKHTADPEGAGRRDVLFVESEDAVYHDYPEHESDALLPALAPSLAAAFATTHYEDAFARVLAAGDAQADALCLEKGIDAQQLEEAEDVLRSRGAEAESRRVRLRDAFAEAGAADEYVERALSELDWHRTTEEGSLLVALETAGVDMTKLDASLKERGLERIDLGVHRQTFRRRRWLLKCMATPILVHRGATTEDVTEELASLFAPDTGFRVVVSVTELLGPLVEWLHGKGLEDLVDSFLDGTLDRADVAKMLGLTVEALDTLEAMTWNAHQRAQMEEKTRQRVVEAAVLDCVTAWLEQEGAHPLPSRVRKLRDTYRIRADDTSVVAVGDADLAKTLAARLEGELSVGPITAIVDARLAGGLPPEAIVPTQLRSEVLAALARDVRKRADRMRESMNENLEEKTPAIPESAAPRKPCKKKISGRKTVGGKFGGPSERERKRRGDRGERLVLGLQVKRLETLGDERRQRALAVIDEALQSSFQGPAVSGRALALTVALDADATEDERIDALATYLDVATWPGFGFDLLGWDEESQRPLFIEVKTTRTANRFIWSEPERRRAKDERDGEQRYRIAVLHRKMVTWLTDPIAQVSLEEKDWMATVVAEPSK